MHSLNIFLEKQSLGRVRVYFVCKGAYGSQERFRKSDFLFSFFFFSLKVPDNICKMRCDCNKKKMTMKVIHV